MRYNTILFDADDTLLDFRCSEREAISDTLADFCGSVDDHVIIRYSEINDSLWKLHEKGEIRKEDLRVKRFELLCREFGFDFDPLLMADRYFSALASKSYLIEGATDVCQTLRKFCRLYIITNGFRVIQEKRLGNSPIAGFFDGLFISETVGAEKPSPAYFETVAKSIPNFLPKDSLVVGDSLSSDIAGGIAAGLDVCWYNPKNRPAPEGMRINYIISRLDQLPDIVTGGITKQ